MGKEIVIERLYTTPEDREVISLEQWRVKRERRRKRVASRMAKRFPLFAVMFMREEFTSYTEEQFLKDIEGMKMPKRRKGKSPLKRQGRYPLLRKALANYHVTKELKYLQEAQRLRNNMYKPFLFLYTLAGETREYKLPSTASWPVVKRLASLKYKSWEELDRQWDEVTRWGCS